MKLREVHQRLVRRNLFSAAIDLDAGAGRDEGTKECVSAERRKDKFAQKRRGITVQICFGAMRGNCQVAILEGITPLDAEVLPEALPATAPRAKRAPKPARPVPVVPLNVASR